ncbi:4'-phosphopantetheinyl transferase family protein [Rhodopseudomonas telluris]|uniref:4'-phosphopantetheinyl transferase family protein n=1 Tax=Rhodopseudomonas telluris TaxID=644215 RepID=A0ABV6EWJ1_9BRAD
MTPVFETDGLVFKTDGLEVLAFMLDMDQDAVDDLGLCLNDEERRRALRLKLGRDRRRFVATHGHLRHVLAARLGLRPSDIEFEIGRLGKPRLPRRKCGADLRFSLSRSADVAVIALANDRDVGVDIEAILPVPEADEIAALCLPASEHASYAAQEPERRPTDFLERWTRLEAVSKAMGCGLGQPIVWDERNWTATGFVPKPGYVGTVVVRN